MGGGLPSYDALKGLSPEEQWTWFGTYSISRATMSDDAAQFVAWWTLFAGEWIDDGQNYEELLFIEH